METVDFISFSKALHILSLGHKAECIDRESCDTRVKGHPKEFHVNRRSRKSSKK